MCPKNKLEEYSSKIKYDLWDDITDLKTPAQKKMEDLKSEEEFFQHIQAKHCAFERIKRIKWQYEMKKPKTKRAWVSPYPKTY